MDDTSTPSLADVLTRAVRAETRDVWVALTARVDAYDRTAGTVDVTPCVRVQVGTPDGVEWRDLGQLRGVRIAWPSGGGVVLTMPIAAGDLVTLLFRDTSHGEVDAGADAYPLTPASYARWSPADAVALPGYTTDRAPHPAAASSSADPVLYMPSGVELRIGQAAATEALALARRVKEELDAISAAFSEHTHAAGSLTAPSSGGTVTGATAKSAAYTASSVASSRVFADG